IWEMCGVLDRWFYAVGLLVSALTVSGDAIARRQQAPANPPPVHLTSEQDHQRLMDLLHITELCKGPDGNPKSPNAANVDESKVPPYTLPDPLVLKSGKKVTTAEMWWKQRRPEIVEEFDREIFGRMPAKTPGVKWEVVSTAKEMSGSVPVVTKK